MRGSISDLSRKKKESANFKVGQLILSSLRNRKEKKKTIETKRHLRHHRSYQHTNNGNPRKKEKGAERTFEEVMTENSPNLMKNKK